MLPRPAISRKAALDGFTVGAGGLKQGQGVPFRVPEFIHLSGRRREGDQNDPSLNQRYST